jgi:hypothetical protein
MRTLAFVALLVGCSDPVPLIDAPAGGSGDAPAALCPVPASYGTLGAKTGMQMGAVPNTLVVVLDAGPPRDSFFLRLVNQKGVFTGGLANGTFSIAGADAQYANCGLCVHILADIATGSGPAKFYFADSGSVTLTNTAMPTGTLTNVHLREVNIMTGAFVADGCESTISSMTFSL